ncbi:membrane protein [Citrobacter amalonaticus Y19]|uniref:Membrane protein n=1 Tax=Citrobacter amalonaticus Y19 TaxID=1261127 RepID=A0A0F6U023_CITAM|nr:membrane protein [Citrobacter amalonaticus Y19]
MRGVLLVLFTFLTFTVSAHPHSFIRLKTEVVSDNGSIVALKMRWTMDELTSADLLYDAGDAKPGSEIWKKLAAEVMANVLGQHYFTEMWHNGQRVKFKNRPTEYGMARDEHQAVLTFVLPLAEPQPLSGQRYTFSTFDPSYYVDMSYEEDRDATLSLAMRERCKIALHTPEPSEASLSFAQSLDKDDAPPEDMELGKQFAQTVTVICQ